MYSPIEFTATDGTVLRGRFYQPDAGGGPSPVVVMASGFSGTMDLRMFPFAEAFAKAGCAVLLYDHRNFGISDGAIRQEIDPGQQVNDWRDAITFVGLQPGVDPQRVGIWGSSYSGGHVLVLGATDARVKCVVSQVPMISGSETERRQARPDMIAAMDAMLAADRSARMRGEPPMMLPVVTEGPMGPAVLPTADAYAFTMAHWGEAPTWRNEVTLRSMELARAYEPGAFIARIAPKPLLMIVGKRDVLTVTDLALDAYSRALEPKELLLVDGGHFDPYDALFDQCASAASAWFVRHL